MKTTTQDIFAGCPQAKAGSLTLPGCNPGGAFVAMLCPRCAEWFDRGEFRDGNYLRIHCRKCRLDLRIERLRRAISAIERDRDEARARIRAARACAGERA